MTDTKPGGPQPPRPLKPEMLTPEEIEDLRADAKAQVLGNIRAGEGNRTLVISLEGCCSTIELHPRRRGAPSLPFPRRRRQPRARGRACTPPPRRGVASGRWAFPPSSAGCHAFGSRLGHCTRDTNLSCGHAGHRSPLHAPPALTGDNAPPHPTAGAGAFAHVP